MKNFALAVVGVAIFAVFMFAFIGAKSVNKGYLRIHIRANSNSEQDQEVKYAVKESVSELLTSLVADVTDAPQAMSIVNANLEKINNAADNTLKQHGFYYGAKTKLCEEYFPTRSYDDLVLKNGLYDALIIELGEGKGDNWWCVVYPPLCFKNNNGKNEIKSVFEGIIKKK